jgi:hypothetical protein
MPVFVHGLVDGIGVFLLKILFGIKPKIKFI